MGGQVNNIHVLRADGDGWGELVYTLAASKKQNSSGKNVCLSVPRHSLSAESIPMISGFSGAVTSSAPQTRMFTYLAMYPELFHFVPLPCVSSLILCYWSYYFLLCL